jgi:hypothetical protein
MIKVYIDENMSPYLADGLDILEKPNKDGIEVLSIKKVFGEGAKDNDWIPKVGKEGGIVITQDLNIHRTRTLKQLYNDSGIGVFFFVPPSKVGYKYWDLVEQIIKRWLAMKSHSKKDKKPFAYRCTSRSSKFEQI